MYVVNFDQREIVTPIAMGLLRRTTSGKYLNFFLSFFKNTGRNVLIEYFPLKNLKF